MKTNYLLTGIILIIVAAAVFYNSYENKQRYEIINQTIEKANATNDFLYKELFFTLKNNMTPIDDCKLKLNDQEIRLSELLLANKLIMYFDKHTCEACIPPELAIINETFANNKNDVLFITNKKNVREINYLQKLAKTDFDIYIFSERENLFDTVYDAPVLFVMNKDRIASSFFTPNKDLSKLSLDYYKLIKQKYFSK